MENYIPSISQISANIVKEIAGRKPISRKVSCAHWRWREES